MAPLSWFSRYYSLGHNEWIGMLWVQFIETVKLKADTFSLQNFLHQRPPALKITDITIHLYISPFDILNTGTAIYPPTFDL